MRNCALLRPASGCCAGCERPRGRAAEQRDFVVSGQAAAAPPSSGKDRHTGGLHDGTPQRLCAGRGNPDGTWLGSTVPQAAR
jgi:hypothetical protein